jgi:hypothetical protein
LPGTQDSRYQDDLQILVTSLLFVVIQTIKQIMDIVTLHQSIRTNYVRIVYALLRDRRFKNH